MPCPALYVFKIVRFQITRDSIMNGQIIACIVCSYQADRCLRTLVKLCIACCLR